MADLDLSKCQAPADVVKKLKLAGREYRNRANLNADFHQNNNPWRVIAKEIDRAVETLEKQFPQDASQ